MLKEEKFILHKKLFCFLILIFIASISTVQASDVYNINNETQINDFNLSDSDSNNLSELSSKSTNIYYKGSYEVVLKDSNSSKPLSNKSVNFLINDNVYNATTDSNGVAGVKLDLNIGKYIVFTFFKGDKTYYNSTLTDTINIESTIKSQDITKYYKGSTPFTAQFLDSTGNALSNKQVSISINGKSYSPYTNNNGFVNLAVDLKPGIYKIISTDPVTGLKLTTTFKVISTSYSLNVKQVSGQNKKLSAKFFKSNGQSLSKKYVKYKFKGKIHKVKTNSKGIISFSLKKFKKGSYKIICYNIDGLSCENNIKIYKRKASTKLTTSHYNFLENDTKEIKIKFSTPSGVNSGKLIKIKINHKSYFKKTDGNGMIHFQLGSFKKGLYKLECSYKGNKFFKSSKANSYISISDTSNTSLKVKSTKSFGYGAGTLFKLSLTAGGIPLIKKTINLNIKGKNYIKTTDNNGIVVLPIDFKIGKYNISYKFNGDSKLCATSGDCEIDVFKRNSAKLSWKCKLLYKDSSQTFRVLLSDLKGRPISGEIVEFTMGDEKYTISTSSQGYAKIKTNLPFGKYKISVKFKGNNNYNSLYSSKKVKVKLSKFGNGLNQKGSSYLKAYLKSSSHCKVGSSKIKKLVKSITKGLTNKVDKAKAIFDYVNEHISYEFYSDTYRGSGGTLKAKKGNCVDMAHLIVSMYRTAGFKARYVHGVCKFNSGHVYGHVWAQVKVGKYWVCADTTSINNQLGKVSNWNTKHYHVHNKYASLPF